MNQRTGMHSCRLRRLADETIARYQLIAPGDAILVGVSGGPDSVALLHVLLARSAEYGLRLGVAHLDHLLRSESGADADFVRKLCLDKGLAFHTRQVDVRGIQRRSRLSLEAAARRERYRFYRETAEHHAYHKVALGHHADDNAETLLLNLLRGSGRQGLGGIAPMREGFFIRPLIQATRSDIIDYLRVAGLAYLSDCSNADNRLLRNRIRGELLPLLERDYQPGARAILNRTAAIFRADEDWLESLVKPILEQAIITRSPAQAVLSAECLSRMPRPAARRVVRAALRQLQQDLQRIGFDHVEQIMELVLRQRDGGPLCLPRGIRVLREADRLVLMRPEAFSDGRASESADFHYDMSACSVLTIRETGDTIAISEVARDAVSDATSSGPQTGFLDLDAVPFPLTIRNIRPGDRFAPLGAGGFQKIKKFFIDHKVPRNQRRRCPLLVSRGQILWVAGYRIDQRASLTPETQRVLKAELFLAKP